MASLDLDKTDAKFQIRAFKPGLIQINDQQLSKSIIVSADELLDWQPQVISELTTESLEPIKTLKPDILLIGTGSEMVILPVEVYGDLINLGIGVEVMDTRAACRTFNALTAENRRVVAALIIR